MAALAVTPSTLGDRRRCVAGEAILRQLALGPATGVDWQIYTQLSAVEDDWRRFQDLADCTVFQTVDWLKEWHRCIGARRGVIPVIVRGLRGDGRPLILLPLAIEQGALIRRLTWLGSELCDYNAPLLAADFADYLRSTSFTVLWSEITRLIRRQPELQFDMVDMEKIPERIGTQKNPMFELCTFPATFCAHVATLENWHSWDHFYTARASSRTRATDRRKLRRLQRRGQVDFRQVLAPREIGRTVDLLIKQKQRSYVRMGVPDAFRRAGYREFYQAVATSSELCDVVHVSRLDVGGYPAATGLGLRFRGRYYLILSSYDDGGLARHSPGRAHISELLRYAISERLDEFDFTIGDEEYKLHWSDVEMKMVGYLVSATVLGRIGVGIKVVLRRVNVFVCGLPSLRRSLGRIKRLLTASMAPVIDILPPKTDADPTA